MVVLESNEYVCAHTHTWGTSRSLITEQVLLLLWKFVFTSLP